MKNELLVERESFINVFGKAHKDLSYCKFIDDNQLACSEEVFILPSIPPTTADVFID